ncbi:MAG: hypothetical protein K5829_13475, partial [Treponema sp.]|nr:hypothetical protein [Treponema sp.]
RVNKKFPEEEIPDTKSMYNWTNAGLIDVKRHELPEAISRKARKKSSSKGLSSMFLPITSFLFALEEDFLRAF